MMDVGVDDAEAPAAASASASASAPTHAPLLSVLELRRVYPSLDADGTPDEVVYHIPLAYLTPDEKAYFNALAVGASPPHPPTPVAGGQASLTPSTPLAPPDIMAVALTPVIRATLYGQMEAWCVPGGSKEAELAQVHVIFSVYL